MYSHKGCSNIQYEQKKNGVDLVKSIILKLKNIQHN